MDIKELIQQEHTRLLENREDIKSRLIFVTIIGSYAQGLNVENSDIDLRACMFDNIDEMFGLRNKEVYKHREGNFYVFGFRHLLNSLYKGNGNTIELFGNTPDKYIIYSQIGHELINNRSKLLSKKVIIYYMKHSESNLLLVSNKLKKYRETGNIEYGIDADKKAALSLRLYLTALYILNHNDIKNYRAEDIRLLRAIREGCFRKEDGTYMSAYYDLIEYFKDKVGEELQRSTLPDNLDMNFLIGLTKRAIVEGMETW